MKKAKSDVPVAEQKPLKVTQNAQTAEVPKPSQSSVKPSVDDAEQPAPPSPLDNLLKTIDPKQIEMANKFIPMKGILTYLGTLEARLAQTDKNFEMVGSALKSVDANLTTLKPLVGLAQQAQAAQTQPGGNPAPQQSNLGGIMQMISAIAPAIVGGGGNEGMNKLAMNALTSQINMSQAITNAVIAKIAGKATSEVANAVV